MSKVNFKVSYDKDNDVLYITLKPGVHSYGDEKDPGIIVRKSFETDEITGITILDFKKNIDEDVKNKVMPFDIDLYEINRSLH